MDLLPCLSGSISDFVNGTEAHEVLCFVGCEGADFDAKDVWDFMSVPRFQFAQHHAVCVQ